jgi:hypothetical protein
MKAGRELDALIAEKVMGIEPWPGRPGVFRAPIVPPGVEPKPCLPPEYSTDIAAAWKLVEKFTREEVKIDIRNSHSNKAQWTVIIAKSPKDAWDLTQADTAPLAICLAALKAVG